MLRILLLTAFLCFYSQMLMASGYSHFKHTGNFIKISTMCNLPVQVTYLIGDELVSYNVNPNDKHEVSNLNVFVTAFKPKQIFTATLDTALLQVASIKCP